MFHSFQLKGSGLYIAGSGSMSEDHPLKMSDAVTECLRLKLLPGHGSSFKNVATELAGILKKEPGTRAMYAGRYRENKDAAEIFVFWDKLESLDAMAAVAEKMAPIHAATGPHLAAPPQMHNAAFNSSALATLLDGEVVQIVTIKRFSVEAKRSEVRAIVMALRSCSTCKGVEVGELAGETKPEETIIIVAGWQGPVPGEDEAPRSSEWWTKETAKLGPGAKFEMHSVKFVKYF